jgi:hypothetical protein
MTTVIFRHYVYVKQNFRVSERYERVMPRHLGESLTVRNSIRPSEISRVSLSSLFSMMKPESVRFRICVKILRNLRVRKMPKTRMWDCHSRTAAGTYWKKILTHEAAF